ncbi:MAG: MltA domain-containing protein [SAR324 cluster bacterium]|nr:MltA domain-containing protein [SAR324 cluster bacterium]
MRFIAPLVFLFMLLIGISGCTVSPQPGIYALTDEQVEAVLLTDELNFESLSHGIERSIQYFDRLSATASFDYGELRYSAQEMKASMRLFLHILENHSGHERIAEIKEKFLFFESRNNSGKAFFTGYYEPLLTGSLVPSEQYPVPIYGVPTDLITVDLGKFNDELKGKQIVGRLSQNQLIPFDERKEISYRNSLNNRASILGYTFNHIELFFLQIQGSGVLLLDDGSKVRLNYAGQNGRSYKAIGALLKEKIPPEEMSMQTLKKYLYEHPEEVPKILSFNPSYTFFRIVEEGPLGNIQVPLTPGRSVAMDHRLIPKGSLAFIETTYPPKYLEGTVAGTAGLRALHRYVLVQDTGGAIRGYGRADIFWGNGETAEKIAGYMQNEGRIILLVARKDFLNSDLLPIAQR